MLRNDVQEGDHFEWMVDVSKFFLFGRTARNRFRNELKHSDHDYRTLISSSKRIRACPLIGRYNAYWYHSKIVGPQIKIWLRLVQTRSFQSSAEP
mgnify:CR=1 FL=1